MNPRIAIIGSGISGLSAAHVLQKNTPYEITLFEAAHYFGGHTNTVDVVAQTPKGQQSYPVDTGFLVFNERTYPNLISLFEELNIPSALSDMSFSVQAPLNERSTLEWSGSSINTVFAQRKNLFNSHFLRMLKDILRFNKLTTELANSGDSERLSIELKTFLENNHFNSYFIHWYLLPMLGCIWSCPTDQMLSFPVSTMIRFCHNHGLLQISNRPRWFTVAGGAKQYVQKITNGIERKFLNTPVTSVERTQGKIILTTPGAVEEFDHVIFATHADQALKIIKDPSDHEHGILSAFKFKDNTAILHTDSDVLPRSRLAWAAWNFESQSRHGELDMKHKPLAHHCEDKPSVCLHYYLNLLQPLPFSEPVVVSLNPLRPINPSKIQAQFEYTHPIFDLETDKAQHLMPSIQGQNNTWFAGAWMGYGFHEDGHKAGSQAAHALISQLQRA